MTTFAGKSGEAGSSDGIGAAARFCGPSGLAADAAGNVYVGDPDDHTIRKVTPGGVVTTLAGMAGAAGSADGTGAAARFHLPYGMALDKGGNLYVTDGRNNCIRKVTADGVVATLAGKPGCDGNADGTGSGAQFTLIERG